MIRFHYTEDIQLKTILFFLGPIVIDYVVADLEEAPGKLAEIEVEI